MIIDAHQHLWQIGHNGHSWPTPDLSDIYRDFTADDLRDVTGTCGVSGTVLVQSQPSDADTDWMLSVARDEPLIRGVVGWTDLLSPDAPERIDELSDQPKLIGLRPMLQGLVDDWILQPAAVPALEAMVMHSLSFDALVFTRHLAAIDRIARAWPQLQIIIDHGAKPPIAACDPDQTRVWRQAITRVARHPNVACKLSGLLTEAAPGQPVSDLLPYAEHLYDSFGPERLMWGSDWPVVRLRAAYRAWFDWVTTFLDTKSSQVRDAVLGGTAARLYALDMCPQNQVVTYAG